MALPQVLAGPIVRRVVGTEVAVWLALRNPATVELVVWAGPQRSTGAGSVESGKPPVARGAAHTKRFGAQLHVAVVVAEASAIIAPGAIHSYDVVVGGQCLGELGFLRDEAATPEAEADARPLRLALGYELDRLPSFVTPAPTINEVPGDLADAAIVYRLMTPVPDNWVPFVAVPAPGGGVELERRPLLHFRDDGTTDVTHPLGVLLNEGGHRLRLAEEEVPRDGAVVTRRYQLARTPDGGTALWIGRRKRVGDGEGWSGLRFDIALPAGSA